MADQDTSYAFDPSTPTVQTQPEKERPALATTKRKFNKLLESLTSSPAKTAAPNPPAESPAKRLRLEARAKLASKTPGQSNVLKSRLAGDAADETTNRSAAEPNYMPWSHEHFLRRLKTFASPRMWPSKPDAINEVQWAKRGWSCEGFNRVCCKGGCERRVVVSLRPRLVDDDGQAIEDSEDWTVDVEDELVQRYQEMIVSEHEETCLWRQAGCRDDVYRLAIAQPTVWKSELKDRYASFKSMSLSIPPLDRLKIPFNLQNLVDKVPPETVAPGQESGNDPAGINQPALAFALMGWRGDFGDAQNALATCNACFRRIGLWMYTSAANSEAELDLCAAHREYCPWVSAASQSMPGSFAGLAAWEILQRVVQYSHGPAGGRDEEGARPMTPQHQTELAEDAAGVSFASPAASTKSREEVEREDKARFARLRELTRSMGLAKGGLKSRLGGAREKMNA